jgi:hypothetical protein
MILYDTIMIMNNDNVVLYCCIKSKKGKKIVIDYNMGESLKECESHYCFDISLGYPEVPAFSRRKL